MFSLNILFCWNFTLEHFIVVDLKRRNKLDEPSAWSAQRDGDEETLDSGLMQVLVYISKNQEKSLKLLSNIEINNRKRKQPREEEEEGGAAHAGVELVKVAPRNQREGGGDPRRY